MGVGGTKRGEAAHKPLGKARQNRMRVQARLRTVKVKKGELLERIPAGQKPLSLLRGPKRMTPAG